MDVGTKDDVFKYSALRLDGERGDAEVREAHLLL